MGSDQLYRFLGSGVTIVVVYFLYQLQKYNAKRVMKKKGLSESRYFMIRKILLLTMVFLCILVLTYIWGIEIRNLWVSVTGLLAMVAIAFFAIWSLIGNLLAGLLLYFTAPFRISDSIEVLPDGIRGRVVAINTLFTLLVDEQNNYIQVPNSLFFQKYLKVCNRQGRNPSSVEPDDNPVESG